MTYRLWIPYTLGVIGPNGVGKPSDICLIVGCFDFRRSAQRRKAGSLLGGESNRQDCADGRRERLAGEAEIPRRIRYRQLAR